MMTNKKKPEKTIGVAHVLVSSEDEGQRIDNYLIARFKGMPKSRIYRMIRKGEVRVNKKRIPASYRLIADDQLRLPPVTLQQEAKKVPPSDQTVALLGSRVLYEDEVILIINKPAGLSVHVGSTVRVGVIEAMRHIYPRFPDLELVHRLDADTSGCLILAKKKKILRELHQLLRNGKIIKHYWALTKGRWKKSECYVDLPLHKDYRDNTKHVVEVNQQGKDALTVFHPRQHFKNASLVEVELLSGRTHQIRVHAAYQGHPIAGDKRYGDQEFNRLARKLGLKRMFLHARSLDFVLPSLNRHIKVVAPLDDELEQGIAAFKDYAA